MGKMKPRKGSFDRRSVNRGREESLAKRPQRPARPLPDYHTCIKYQQSHWLAQTQLTLFFVIFNEIHWHSSGGIEREDRFIFFHFFRTISPRNGCAENFIFFSRRRRRRRRSLSVVPSHKVKLSLWHPFGESFHLVRKIVAILSHNDLWQTFLSFFYNVVPTGKKTRPRAGRAQPNAATWNMICIPFAESGKFSPRNKYEL